MKLKGKFKKKLPINCLTSIYWIVVVVSSVVVLVEDKVLVDVDKVLVVVEKVVDEDEVVDSKFVNIF